jgi:uncharacterized protein involved in exopolysaccharide biosynthesis
MPDSPLLAGLTAIIQHRRRLVGIGLAAGSLLAAVALVKSPRYTSDAVLVPSAPGAAGAGQLRGIASQLGLGDALAATGAPISTPSFIAQTAISHTVLANVLTASIRDSAGNTISVAELVVPDPLLSWMRPHTAEEAEALGVKALRRLVTARSDRETGSVKLTVRTKNPRLSEAIATAVITRLDSLNITLASGKARSEREFVEERARNQRLAVLSAEQELAHFLERNRDFSNSAALRFEHDRLQRSVDLQQQILTGLLQSLEDVRIREVQDTPTLSIVEAPRFPAMADSRGVPAKFILGFVAGIATACSALILAAALRQAAGRGSESARIVLRLLQRGSSSDFHARD